MTETAKARDNDMDDVEIAERNLEDIFENPLNAMQNIREVSIVVLPQTL